MKEVDSILLSISDQLSLKGFAYVSRGRYKTFSKEIYNYCIENDLVINRQLNDRSDVMVITPRQGIRCIGCD